MHQGESLYYLCDYVLTFIEERRGQEEIVGVFKEASSPNPLCRWASLRECNIVWLDGSISHPEEELWCLCSLSSSVSNLLGRTSHRKRRTRYRPGCFQARYLGTRIKVFCDFYNVLGIIFLKME